MAAANRRIFWSFGPRTRIALVLGTTLMFAGCAYDPVYYGPPAYPAYYPSYYDYYYYPSVGVYFHFTSGYYYYRDKSRWHRVKRLPPNIHIDAKDRVKLRVESDKPYKRYPEHHRQYQPKPNYRVDKGRDVKEREANRRWYQNYEQHSQNREKPDRGYDRGQDRGYDRGQDNDWIKHKRYR